MENSELENLLTELKHNNAKRQRAFTLLLSLSLIVICIVFYSLRLTGITLAGDANCGIPEHTHSAECEERTLICPLPEDENHTHDESCYSVKLICGLEEHIHDLSCYSDENADVETPAVWEETFSNIDKSNKIEALLGIAYSQLGYTESEKNYVVDGDEKLGYTRYGAWYGSPHGRWSAMFTSFCLKYAGFTAEETPFSQGGTAMQNAWEEKGLFKACGEYYPKYGDIVFFKNGLTGIVFSYERGNITAIVGDSNNKVEKQTFYLSAENVVGYGELPEERISRNPYIADTAPSVSITPPQFEIEAQPIVVAAYRLMATVDITDKTNIKDYIESTGGSFVLDIINADNSEIPRDENGNLLVEPNKEYKLAFNMSLPSGIKQGSYYYKLPDGLTLAESESVFKLTNGEIIGMWSVSADGYITFDFNEKANNYTDVLISASMGIIFNVSDTTMDFDGDITVVIKPQEEPESDKITVEKWGYGVIKGENGEYIRVDNGFDRIYWTVTMTGTRTDGINGEEMSDQITTTDAIYFSEEDMERGITIGFTGSTLNPNETSEWHCLTINKDTPGVEWTEQGWKYTMPNTPTCSENWCSYKWDGNQDKVINLPDNWTYYITYYTTVKAPTKLGQSFYGNTFTIDEQPANATISQNINMTDASIDKSGFFSGLDGRFHWTVDVNIPKHSEEMEFYPWGITDLSQVHSNLGLPTEYAGTMFEHIDKVTATIDGVTYNVPYVTEANGEPISYCFQYVSDTKHYMQMYLLTPCHCTEETCTSWLTEQNSCYSLWATAGGVPVTQYGYCTCWSIEKDVQLHFEYSVDGNELIQTHGGHGGIYYNTASLIRGKKDAPWESDEIDNSQAKVSIPTLFDKELISDPNDTNGYIASYTITVNESKIDLSKEGFVKIHDKMSNTLMYIPGTMIITTQDADGNEGVLEYGTDFTLERNDSGNELDIVINNPGAVMYTLKYDCKITIPEGQTTIKFSNSADVTLFGKTFTDEQKPETVTDIVITASNYRVEGLKLRWDTDTPLQNALIGLFAQDGELIDSSMSDENGKVEFSTDISNGIYLQDHVLYYLQEITPPSGYIAANEKHWLFFCDKQEKCVECDAVLAGSTGDGDVVRIPVNSSREIIIYNRKLTPVFPETGGNGLALCYTIGSAIMLIPCIYVFIRRLRHKLERRSSG